MALDLRYKPPLRMAYAWLAAWGLWAIWSVLDYRNLASPSLVVVHFLLLGVGFGGNLLMGLGHHLAAHFSVRPPPPRWLPAAEAVLVSAGTAMGTYATLRPAPGLLPWASRAWALALVVFAVGLLVQVVQRPRASLNPYSNGLPGDRTSDAMLYAVTAYAAFAGVASWLDGMTAAPVVHLWLVGTLATAVFMVIHRVLPRFSKAWMPPWVHAAQGVAASVGPALLAIGMDHSRRLALWGGALEYVAILFYVLLAGFAWRHRKNRHPALALPALGALFLVWGASLGLWFLHDASMYVHLGVHAVNNLWGFLVLTALGMASAMLGLGVVATFERPNRRVWRIGLGAATAMAAWEMLAWLDSPWAAVPGLALGVAAIVQGSWGWRLPFAGKSIRPRPLAPTAAR